MVFNTYADFLRELRLNEDEVSEDDSDYYLGMANLRIQGEIGHSDISETFTVEEDSDGNVINYFYLFFKPVISVNKVYLNDDLIDSSNYSLDATEGKVTFSNTLYTDDDIKIEYYPELLKLWERKLASFYFNSALKLTTTTNTTDLVLDRLSEEISSIEKIVKSLPKMAYYTDNKGDRREPYW